MSIKNIIFDLDGTVVTFNLDYKTVRAHVKDTLVNNGVPSSILSLNESVFEMLRKTEVWARSSQKETQFQEEVRNEVFAITEKHELEASLTTNLLPGVVGTLRALREMGLKIGLCTINSKNSVNRILERFGIGELFDVVISRNHVRHVKPDPEHLEVALRKLGASPGETIVVGDSTVDMQSAQNLRAVAVGVPTGVSTMEQLMAGGADYIITSMADLPILIKQLKKC